MAAIRFSVLKSLRSSINPASNLQYFRAHESSAKFVKSIDQIDARPTLTCINCHCNTTQSCFTHFTVNNGARMMNLESPIDYHLNRTNHVSTFSSALLNTRLQSNSSLFGICPLLNYRSYSSSSNQGANPRIQEVPAASGASGPDAGSSSGISGNDWVDKAKDAWQLAMDAATFTGQKAKEASNEMTPYVEQLLNTHPYLRDVIVPVGGTFIGTLLAWFVMPRVLKRFHKYSTQGPAVLLSGSTVWGPVPYENSFWGALEDPLRYLVTFMAFSQIAVMVAPTTIASQYLAQTWRGAVILSFVWFLHRWKTNVISRALAIKSVEGVDRDKLLTLDKISSVGLFVLGLMALAEACGVAVQSIITVGGIGGVATAFAARDILGNVLSGLSVQISRPFSIGDTIKAGSVEGQVVEVGLTTTSLLSAERFPVIVPNSLFSSQVIVNKSRAGWRAMVTKIPLQIGDFEKIPQISNDIKTMLKSNSNVFLEKEAPYCFLSRIERSYAELTLGCNLKYTSKDKLLTTEQDILLQSARIIKQHGASLGSALDDMYNP